MSESICKQVQKLQQSHDETLVCLELMTELAAIKWGNSDEAVYKAIGRARAAIKNAEKVNEYNHSNSK